MDSFYQANELVSLRSLLANDHQVIIKYLKFKYSFLYICVSKGDTFKIHPRSKSTRVQNPPDQNPPGQTREPLTGRV